MNAVRTAPALSNTYAINANANTTFGGYTFANYLKAFNAKQVTGISYVITGASGTKTVTNLAGNVHQGDTVTANFTVAAGANVTLSLVSYHAPGPVTTASNISLQEISQVQTATFGAGKHSLTVTVPDCYFQVDFVGGTAIDHFGPAGSNILYQQEGRLISADMGGDHCCDCDEQPKLGELHGSVYLDTNGDCEKQPGETGIGGVTITLFGGNLGPDGLTTKTDSLGNYSFTDLQPGTYIVVETQPGAYLHEGQDRGSLGGVEADHKITTISLPAGGNGTDYNFCEVLPSSIAGRVFCDDDLSGTFTAGDDAIVGLKISLTGTTSTGDVGHRDDPDRRGRDVPFRQPPPGQVHDHRAGARRSPRRQELRRDRHGRRPAGQASAAGPDTVSGILLTSGAGQDATGYDFAEIHPGSLAGKVWVDFNGDGKIDFGEKGLSGVKIALSGTDDLGNAVTATMTTDTDGAYAFKNLRPGTYTLIETQPAGYAQGKDLLGTLGGDAGVQDVFSKVFVPGCDGDGIDYNFGEQPCPGTSLLKGGTATIGFWHNKNGQALLLALNGGPTATQLGNWMAVTFPNLYGSLAGKTNAEIAAYYLNNLFSVTGQKLGAQVMSAVFAVYCTNASLAGNVAAGYGFTVSTSAPASRRSTSAATAPPSASRTIRRSPSSRPSSPQMRSRPTAAFTKGNTTLGNQANAVFDAINQGGIFGEEMRRRSPAREINLRRPNAGARDTSGPVVV